MVDKLLVGGLIAAVSVPLIAQTAAPVAPAPVVRIAPVTPPAPMAMRTMTRAEVQAKVAEHFARMDTNKDGALTMDEARPGRGDRMKRVEIRKERAADPNVAFDRLDADRNGAISRDEFARAREQRIEKRIEMKGAKADMHRMHMRHHGGGMAMMRGPMMLKMADANKDGRITLQEATGATLQHFDMADTNRDGRLTPDEMRAAHQKMRDMRMPKAS